MKITRAIDNKTSNEFIEELRQRRYREECDPLYLSLVEAAAIANTTLDLSSWLELKAQIRIDLPYVE
jgi:hypothetical protein